MARKAMVTRTITTTKVTLMCLNLKSCEPFNDTVTLPRTYDDEKKLLELVRDAYDTEEKKAVAILSKEVIETLYGMSEEDFIKNASILNPETRKAMETDTETSEN